MTNTEFIKLIIDLSQIRGFMNGLYLQSEKNDLQHVMLEEQNELLKDCIQRLIFNFEDEINKN